MSSIVDTNTLLTYSSLQKQYCSWLYIISGDRSNQEYRYYVAQIHILFTLQNFVDSDSGISSSESHTLCTSVCGTVLKRKLHFGNGIGPHLQTENTVDTCIPTSFSPLRKATFRLWAQRKYLYLPGGPIILVLPLFLISCLNLFVSPTFNTTK